MFTACITGFVNILIGDTNDCEIGFYRENTENRTRSNIGRELNKDLSSTSELRVGKFGAEET